MTATAICDDLPHGLAAGVMVKKRQEGALVKAGESKFLQRAVAVLAANSLDTGTVGVQARRFPVRAKA